MSYEAPLPVHERFTAPNGAPIDIYRENGTDFVKLVDITRALGYAKGSTAVRGINFALKSAQIPIFEKKTSVQQKCQLGFCYTRSTSLLFPDSF